MANQTHYDTDEDGKESEAPPLDVSNLAVVSNAEIDQQIATAKRYPRSISQFRRQALEMATLNTEVARQCYYVLPQRRGSDKAIEGPSARFAEIIIMAYGNTRSAARVTDIGDEYITAEAIFYDLEKNNAIRYEVMRRITTKEGTRYGSDMIGVTGNAACAIAHRNAVLKGIPKAFWADIYEKARAIAGGDGKTLNQSRETMLKDFKALGVTPQEIYDHFDIKGPHDLTTEHLITLGGYHTAIKEGDTTAEQIFGAKGDGKARVGEFVPMNRPRNEFERPNAAKSTQAEKREPQTIDQEAKPTQEAEPTKQNTKPQPVQEPGKPPAEPEPKATAPQQQAQREREPGDDADERTEEDEIADYFKDRVADLPTCKNAREVGDLRDNVVPNLGDARATKFIDLCLARTREILAATAKGPGRKK